MADKEKRATVNRTTIAREATGGRLLAVAAPAFAVRSRHSTVAERGPQYVGVPTLVVRNVYCSAVKVPGTTPHIFRSLKVNSTMVQ